MDSTSFKTDSLASMLRDESGYIGSAAGICFPESIPQVQHAVRDALAHHQPVTIQGSRTGFYGDALPHGGYVINLSKLCGVIGFSFEETVPTATITVQAGITLQGMNHLLRAKKPGIFSPDDVSASHWARYLASPLVFYFPANPTEDTASIGGMIATDASGSHSYAFGGIRTQVLSVSTVLPQGESRTSLSPADWHPPMILTACTLKLTLELHQTYGLLALFDSYSQLTQFWLEFQAQAAAQPDCKLLCADFFDPACFACLDGIKEQLPSIAQLPTFPAKDKIAFWLELTAEEDASLLELLETALLCMEHTGADPERTLVAADSRELLRLQQLRHTVTEAANLLSYGKEKRILERTVHISRYGDLLEEISTALKEHGLPAVFMGYFGLCNLQIRLLPQENQIRLCDSLLNKWRDWE